jgi:hypothetical protein
MGVFECSMNVSERFMKVYDHFMSLFGRFAPFHDEKRSETVMERRSGTLDGLKRLQIHVHD